jgi:hypothetical protein
MNWIDGATRAAPKKDEQGQAGDSGAQVPVVELSEEGLTIGR